MDIAHEKDIEILRQKALLLQKENDRLHRRLQELVAEVQKAAGKDAASLQQEIALLQEQLARQNQELFGRSSEKREAPAVDSTGTKAAKTGHGPTAQPELPLVEVVHELDEADQVCPQCGAELSPWKGQYEEAEEVDVVERSFRIVRHKRQKYRCRCGSCVETAVGPVKLIPGGRYSLAFAVAVAVAKYADHLPLARQQQMMLRQGLVVERSALWDQLWALYEHLEPTWEALHAYVLSSPVVGADETRWRMLEGNQQTPWWAWTITRPDAVCYRIQESRSAKAAGEVLKGFRGTLVVDGYSAYPTLRRRLAEVAEGGPPFEMAFCWAHVRRKFVEAEPAYPQAAEALALIGRLYEVERRARDGDLEHLAELRRVESAPILDELLAWMQAQSALPRSGLGKAIGYTLELWTGLRRFLSDPNVPLDNNATEREIRPLAVGRKNHYGSKSLRGTKAAALLYSLVESAKLVGLDPAAYLEEATRRAIANPGTVTLPRDLLPAP